MLRRRKILLALSLLTVLGSLGATGGYAAYLHSDAYRARTERRLAEFFGVPLTVGGITPLSLSSRLFREIEVFLPRRTSRVFACQQAVWQQAVRDGREYHVLDLTDGALTAGEDDWDASDYRTVLETGLGHDFAHLGVGEVHLTGMDVAWRGRGIGLQLQDASGVVLFAPDGSGQAAISARSLNARTVASPINISARFTPGASLTLHEAVLTVPPIDLAALDLPGLIERELAEGSFAGRVTYNELPDGRRLRINGSLHEAALEALTGEMIGGPFHGRVNVEVEEADVLNRRLQALRFRGRLEGLRLSEIAPGLQSPDGKAELRVQQATLTGERIDYLSAAGRVNDLSFEAITGLFGRGIITGKLGVTIHSLHIEDDHIRSADVTLTAVPPDGKPGTIDRDVLISAARETLGFDVSKLLPAAIQNIEYTQLGARLIVDGTALRVRGTHGPDNDTVLTIRLLGREWGILKAPERTFTIPDLVALARQRLEPYRHEPQRVRDWWIRQHPDE